MVLVELRWVAHGCMGKGGIPLRVLGLRDFLFRHTVTGDWFWCATETITMEGKWNGFHRLYPCNNHVKMSKSRDGRTSSTTCVFSLNVETMVHTLLVNILCEVGGRWQPANVM